MDRATLKFRSHGVMGIGSIGGTPSFYQQDQSFWSNAQSQDASQAATDSLINAMGSAMVNEAKGLASIANQTAINRVNTQLSAAIQSLLDGGTSSGPASSSGSSGASASSSATGSSASTRVQPASGTGTVPVTTTTSLASLGILPGGTISFGDGSSNTTVYTSTGSDTVGDLINAINNGPAFLTAAISSSGKLTVTARDTTASVVISGTGTDAAAIGFGNKNDTFQPVKPAASGSAASTASGTAGSSTASTSSSAATGTSTSGSSESLAAVTSVFEESASSAASILSASGVSGSLVNLLA